MAHKFHYQCDADYRDRAIQRLEVRVKQHVRRELLRLSQKTKFGCSQAYKLVIGDQLCDHYISRTNYSHNRKALGWDLGGWVDWNSAAKVVEIPVTFYSWPYWPRQTSGRRGPIRSIGWSYQALETDWSCQALPPTWLSWQYFFELL